MIMRKRLKKTLMPMMTRWIVSMIVHQFFAPVLDLLSGVTPVFLLSGLIQCRFSQRSETAELLVSQYHGENISAFQS